MNTISKLQIAYLRSRFMKPLEQLFPLLTEPKKVVITTHQKPDADAMGSSLALRLLLLDLGHSVTVISPTNWAGWVDWMPGVKEVLDYEMNRQKANAILDEAEWLFCLDFNIFHRTKTMTEKLKELTCTKILIDHHQEPDVASFDYGKSDVSKSSTCEMIYDFITESGYGDKINEEISECLYAGIVGDTGSFRFSSAHQGVHKLVADLKSKGLNHGPVHDRLFDNFLENRLRFVGHVLLHRMEVFYEYNTVLIAIPKSDLIKYQIKTGDTEGLVNFPQFRYIIGLQILCNRYVGRNTTVGSKCHTILYCSGKTYFHKITMNDALGIPASINLVGHASGSFLVIGSSTPRN